MGAAASAFRELALSSDPGLGTHIQRRWRMLLRRNKRYLWKLRMSYRLLSADSRTLPRFLVIGAQRGGTTALYTYLIQHPHILRAARKEVHFFDLHFHEGVGWYRAHFPLCSTMARRGDALGGPILTGEATPYYLFHPDAPQRIASVLPGVRLIALLRDPVARAYSHYTFAAGGGRDRLTFKEAVRWERDHLDRASENGVESVSSYGSRNHMRHSYLARGIYARQLKAYFDCFDRKDVLVACSENLFRDPQGTCDVILRFLGLGSCELRDSKPRNTGLYGRRRLENVDDELLSELRAFFQPFNKELYDLLGIDFHWGE